MTQGLNRSALLVSFMVPVFLSACADDGGVTGVSQAQYDSVVAENQQLQAHVRRLQSAVKYTVNSDLLFPSGGYELSEAGKETIAKVAQFWRPAAGEAGGERLYRQCARRSHPAESGHYFEPGSVGRRANAVMNYMISQGVKAEFLSAQGWGEADPIATNSTASGRAQNRRVEITIAGS